MILFQNSIVKLDYDPATDIVEVMYPDLHGFLLPEIKHTIDIIVDVMKSYDVKKMLLDSTKTVSSVTEDESREVAVYLAAGVANTRVQKVARIQSMVSTVESNAQNNIRHIQGSQLLPYQLKNFTSKADALAWLSDASR